MSRFFGSVKFFRVNPLIINKKVYNFIFPGGVQFSVKSVKSPKSGDSDKIQKQNCAPAQEMSSF